MTNMDTINPKISTKTVFIYTLSDPRSSAIRYVGKTVDLRLRYWKHTSQFKKTHCSSWIKNLVSGGFRPQMAVIDEVTPGEDWANREAEWIRHYRQSGSDLTNHTSGGEGFADYRIPPDIAKKRGEKMRGRKRAAWEIENCRRGQLGKTIPMNVRQKIAATLTGRKASKESILKRLSKIKGLKRTAQQKAEMSLVQRNLPDAVKATKARKVSVARQGENARSHVFTEAEIREMRSLGDAGIRPTDIWRWVGKKACRQTIQDIVARRTWKHIP